MIKYFVRGAVLWGLVAWAAGCGSQADRDPRILADVTVVKPTDPVVDPAKLPQPVLQVVEPEKGTRFPVANGRGTNGGIRCVVRLEVPSGGQIPETVTAQLLHRDRLSGSVGLKPQGDPKGDVWILEGTLDSPQKKGSYKIRAEGMQTVIVSDDIMNTKPSPDAFKTVRLYSEPTDIRIGD